MKQYFNNDSFMFDEQFEIILADSPESREIHYSIRYQVYCEEMGFENSCDFPFNQEFDAYDNRSVHFLVRNKTSGQWIGAMRLICKTDRLLPIERHCRLDKSIDFVDPDRSVELSRLCLINQIRRKFSDINLPDEVIDDSDAIKETDKIRSLSHCRINRSILWGLIYAAAKYSYQNNISNWYFMTTQSLEKILRKGGLELQNIGDPCDYKGRRYPFVMNAFDTFLNEIWQDHFRIGYRLFSELNRTEKRKAA